MSNRFQDVEELAATARQELPGVAIAWLEAARKEMEKLTMAALSGDVSDEEFAAMVEATSQGLPGLLDKLDHAPLETLMENTMGAAMGNGIASRMEDSRPAVSMAKLPWEVDAYLAGKGKKCGGSYIPAWKKCRLSAGSVEDILAHIKEGRDGNYTAKGKPLDAKPFGMVKKHAPMLRKTAVPTASSDDVRHALKNHTKELTADDWASVLIGPRPGDTVRPSRTDSGSAAIEVFTPRPSGYLLKVYRVTASKLSIHTMKRTKEK